MNITTFRRDNATILEINDLKPYENGVNGQMVDCIILKKGLAKKLKNNPNIYFALITMLTPNSSLCEKIDINEESKFTIGEIRKYLLSKDSMGDILYYLSSESINEANQIKEDFTSNNIL